MLVATVLTVYGIETAHIMYVYVVQLLHVATVLTVYGIETIGLAPQGTLRQEVATVLTVYGIETILFDILFHS